MLLPQSRHWGLAPCTYDLEGAEYTSVRRANKQVNARTAKRALRSVKECKAALFVGAYSSSELKTSSVELSFE
jgi:hypothetical protein